jgi:hypothetical protein
MVYKKSIASVLSILLIGAGCGMYSFTGSLPSTIQTIAVPLFDDNTAYPNIREDLTNKVVDAFIADNTLKIVNESDADLLINGTINSISQRAAVLTSGEDVQEFQIYVNVKVTCEDVKNGKIFWEKTLSQFGSMAGSGTQDERDLAIADAIEKITEDILNNTLANW